MYTKFHKIITAVLFICGFALKAQPAQHQFTFKGFATRLCDEAADEKGNHVFVGEIHAIEKQAANRDSSINRIFNLKGIAYDDKLGILIKTDKNYKILQIESSFIGEKIIYDVTKKQFIIGALFFDYLKVNDRSFSVWQPVIMQTGTDLKVKYWFVKKPYSCILKSIQVEDDKVIIFTRNDNTKTGKENGEKAGVITVKLSKSHTDSARPWIKVLDILSEQQTPYEEIGRMTISEVSKVGKAYFFTTSNLNQFDLKNINHLYRFSNNSLTEVKDLSLYLSLNDPGSNWININEFLADANGYLFLTHQGATKKQMILSQTDLNFYTKSSKKITLNDYADFNTMIHLANANHLILAVGQTKEWTCFLYNSNMDLIKEVNTGISKDYYPNKLKEISNNNVECLFYIDNNIKKDCILQIVPLN